MSDWFRTGDNTATFTYAVKLASLCARLNPDYEFRVRRYDKRYWIEHRLVNNQQTMLWEYAR